MAGRARAARARPPPRLFRSPKGPIINPDAVTRQLGTTRGTSCRACPTPTMTRPTTIDDDYEPPLDEGDEYDSAGANPDSETDSIAGDDERNFDSDEEDFGVGGGVGDVPGLRAAGDLGDPGVAETPTAPVSAPLLLPPPPPRAPPPRERAEGGARGPAGLGIPETMGVSGRAPRNVRSVYASSNAPDANTVRREGETDAVVPAPAGGTSEPSGDRRRGDGAITKRRRVGTENAIDDPEPTLGCARCRHSQKGCDRCKAKHAKWAARNGAAGDGIEPERAPSGADDDRDEERESQHGDADAAHDAVDVAVAVADAAVADAGVSRCRPRTVTRSAEDVRQGCIRAVADVAEQPAPGAG